MTDIEIKLQALDADLGSLDASTPPRVVDLRRELERRRRRRDRRRSGVAAIVAVLAGAGVAALVTGPDPDARVVAVADDAPESATTTSVPTPEATVADDGASSTGATPADAAGTGSALDSDTADGGDPSDATGGVPAPAGEWSMLVPGDPWTVTSVSANAATQADDLDRYWAATEDDWPFGPVVFAYYNPGLRTRDYVDGPQDWDEKASPGGTIVRLGSSRGPEALSAIFLAAEGSVAAFSAGLSEEELLAVVDDMVADGRGVHSTGAALPAGLQTLDPPTSGNRWVTTAMAQRDGVQVTVLLTGLTDDWMGIVEARRRHPDAEEVTVVGNRGIVYEETGDGPAGAALLTPDGFYEVLAPWGPDGASSGVEEVIGVLDSLDRLTATELMAELDGLQDRSAVYESWFATTPLPPDGDVDFLLGGPPVEIGSEAVYAHQVFACAWVGHWVDTGDPGALDLLLESDDWPTGVLVDEEARAAGASARPDGVLLFLPNDAVEAARGLTNRDDRASSALRQECSFLLGFEPGS